MGTSGITNLTNDLNLINVDIPKNTDSNGEFAKTFESVSQSGDLEATAKRDINVVEELKTSDNVKDNYYKETNGKKFEDKVEKVETKANSAETPKSTSNSDKITTEEAEEVVDAADEAVMSIINAYCEMFDITSEEMQSFMEENDLTVTDLLDVSKVQDIVMQLNGISDSVDILTNDALYDSIKNLEALTSDTAANLAEELGLNVEDLSNAILNAEQFEEIAIEEPVIDEVKAEAVPVKQEAAPIVNESKDNVKIADNEFKADTDKIAPVSHENKSSDIKKETRDDSNSNASLSSGQTSNDAQIQNNVQVTNEENLSFSTRAQEIYDQIGEYVRNLSTENLNEIELKLQPETLGTIHIRVSQSEGIVKAELVTANENVRSIIEGQLIQLKEDFDRSGIRVDEVEVRVSTNEFNENTESDARDEANERAGRQTTTRRIDISDIGDLEEIDEYEDDEKIAVEMMAANGNSMDYRA